MDRLTRYERDVSVLKPGGVYPVDNPRAFDQVYSQLPEIPTIVQQLHNVEFHPHRLKWTFFVRYFDGTELLMEVDERDMPHCPGVGDVIHEDVRIHQLEMYAVAEWKKARNVH